MIEKTKHKEAFDKFYTMGAGRSLSGLAKKLSISRTSLQTWSKLFNWPGRIQELDKRGEKKKHGRRTKLTPEMQANIVKLIKAGNYVETACNAVGISDVTYYNWLNRGDDGEEPYLSFFKAIKKAEAMGETISIGIITKASLENWQAAAWRLERRNFQKWGRKAQVDVSVKDLDKQIELAMKQLAAAKDKKKAKKNR